jgi:hypothetical protein
LFRTTRETGLPGSCSDGINQGESTVGVGMLSNASSASGDSGVSRGYPEGFSGIDIHFRVGESPMLPVVHAYKAAPEPVIETLYLEGFHAHQMEHFSPIPDARPDERGCV